VVLENSEVRVIPQSNGGWLLPVGLTISKGESAGMVSIVAGIKSQFDSSGIAMGYDDSGKSTDAMIFIFVGAKPIGDSDPEEARPQK
jgi:hypothetical protein